MPIQNIIAQNHPPFAPSPRRLPDARPRCRNDGQVKAQARVRRSQRVRACSQTCILAPLARCIAAGVDCARGFVLVSARYHSTVDDEPRFRRAAPRYHLWRQIIERNWPIDPQLGRLPWRTIYFRRIKQAINGRMRFFCAHGACTQALRARAVSTNTGLHEPGSVDLTRTGKPKLFFCACGKGYQIRGSCLS